MFHIHKHLTVIIFLLVLAVWVVPLREVAADASGAGSRAVMTIERSDVLSTAKATAAVKLLSAVETRAVEEARDESWEHLVQVARSTSDEANQLQP
jgi:hypothetical protein